MAAQAKKQIGSLFRKNLLDLVKGLRSHKTSESEYINQCLSEIKEEVKSIDKETKAAAISKLTYLYMLGYDISFAHFNVVEVMSQPSFTHRRIAYLAASLSFTVDTDVILLTVHLFKKRFKNASGLKEGAMYEQGCAINCLANICTPYLAESLLEDIYSMMNSSKPYLRKKAVLVLYSIFRKFPRALRVTFDRLRDKLADEDGGVQNAAVNVICELARKNPSNYLSLLPHLFDLLNNSNNNWMLIKLVKLLGSLIPAEPRLGRKLLEPLTHIISNTPAKSLLYECINTVTAQHTMQRSMVRLCLDKLRGFVEDQDQNLKYLGLLGLNKIMDKNKKAVSQHKDLILQCLDDTDITIRMRALDLITSMVNAKNLEIIIQRLTDHLYGTDGSYRDHVLEQIISVSCKHDYEFVRDFAWYVQLLTNMTALSGMCKSNALRISQQLMDVTIRVPEVREFSVHKMEHLLINYSYSNCKNTSSIQHILIASAYIVGEYSTHVSSHLTLVSAMLQHRISSLPQNIQCIFIHNALKVVLSQISQDLITSCIRLLAPLCTSHFLEVQERSNAYLFLMRWLLDSDHWRPLSVDISHMLFGSELMPLHPNSQKVVSDKVPHGLDLEQWIFEDFTLDSASEGSQSDSGFDDLLLSDIEDQNVADWYSDDEHNGTKKQSKKSKKSKQKSNQKFVEAQKLERKERQIGPWYIHNDDDSEETKDKPRKKRKGRKGKKLTESEIENADIGRIETDVLGNGIKVIEHSGVDSIVVDKKQIPKHLRHKKYTVLTKDKNKNKNKTKSSVQQTMLSQNERGYTDDLSQDIDLTKPVNPNEMEQFTIKPYSQTEIEQKQKSEIKKDKPKKEKRKKSKKEKKRLKKEKKKLKKRERKKLKQKNGSVSQTTEDLLGFMKDSHTGTGTGTGTQFENDDFLNGIFEKSKAKQTKNGKISKNAMESLLLFEDERICVTYSSQASNSNVMKIVLITENVSANETIKSVKLTLSKDKASFKPKEKDKFSYNLGKKLAVGATHKCVMKVKCVQFFSSLKCKVSYGGAFKSPALPLKFDTHSFIVNSQSHQGSDDLQKMIADKDMFEHSVTQRLKLAKHITCGQCLDTLVKVWRVTNVSMTDKKSIYYAKLMLDKHLAIHVKTNTKKNAIEITLSSNDERFIQSMMQQFQCQME